ncbi:hypothetical protein AAGF08_00460 [Algoriphagus sp. SE2]|uniref:hypothetical protein n=1 Tax=Algoriphagus sp. SE2 TaxID=3141536 RepID=UPI0031CD08AC
MDSIVNKFEKLFSIRFSHDAFPFSASTGGVLTPNIKIDTDPTTTTLFTKHSIYYRWRNDTLICFIRIKTEEDSPFFRLPNNFNARFFINLSDPIKDKTEVAPNHGKENIYRFRINVRASSNSMNLAGATLGPLAAQEPIKVFNPGNPGSWTTTVKNLSGHFGVIDIVTEGSSTHRLYTDVANQNLFYTTANGNENEHLFTIHLNN